MSRFTDRRAVFHVLHNILSLNSTLLDQAEGWLHYHEIDTLDHLFTLYLGGQQYVQNPYYVVDNNRSTLDRQVSLSFLLICLYTVDCAAKNHAIMSSQDWLSTTKIEFNSFTKPFMTNQTWLDTIEREYQDYCSTHRYLTTNEDSDIESTTNDDSDNESYMNDDSDHESTISHESNNDFYSHVKTTINFDSAC